MHPSTATKEQTPSLPQLIEAIDEIYEQTGIKFWYTDVHELYDDVVPTTIDTSGYIQGKDYASLFDDQEGGLAPVDIYSLFEGENFIVRGYLLTTPAEQKRVYSVEDLISAVQSSFERYVSLKPR